MTMKKTRSTILYIMCALLASVAPASAQTINGNVYGGGEMAKVEGSTNVTINTGQLAGSIFGGGEGALNNDGTVKASADISGYTTVTINGGEIVYTVGDPDNLRNIYGGGNLACNVAGNTNVTMTKGIITTYSFVSDPRAMAAWRYFYDNSMKPNQQKTPICSVFGAGYGAHTDVAGNTNVNINIPGSADIHPADGIAFTHAELEAIDRLALRLKPSTTLSAQFVPSVFGGGFDGTVGAYDPAANAGAGGINYDKTTYTSQTNITIQGQPFVFNVFGGGLGSKSGADANGGVNSHVGAVYGATKVDIQGGLYNGSVFGGGAGIEAEGEILNPFTGVGTVNMPYTYVAQVMRETDVTISGNTTVIFGNVYGGGDIANTGWYYENARPTMDGHVAQQNNSLATFDYTTSLNLNGGNILGSVFGGGNGRTKSQMTMSMFVGTICGSTNVSLRGTKVWSHVYGGGNMGTVFKCETIAASKGESGRAMATGIIDGCTNVAILSGMVAKDIFGGGFGDDPGTGDANVTSADIYGNTYVYFASADLEFSKYWKPRTFLPSTATDVEMAAEVTGRFLDQSSAGLKRDTESDITHNLYGGGNMACDVKGNTHVYMIGAPTAPADFNTTDYYKECIANVAKPHFSVFGGGFGTKAKVSGNAYSDISLQAGTGLYSIIGGGLNGTVSGACQVHVGNDPMSRVHYVYGGGYYAPCGSTKLEITRGNILENVFGGAVMGNINAGGAATDIATNVTIGLKAEGANSSVVLKDEFDNTLRSYTYAQHQNQITIGGDVYGGNDVSGTVYGIAKLNIFGGTLKGDVYGAGNGDHIGYYTPGLCRYDFGENDNYYAVDHSGETSTDGKGTVGPKGDTYKGRPQTTGGVELTLAGNTADEKVSILGQVFGGGNSCTVGAWDANLLTNTYSGNPHLVRDDPDYFLGGGKIDVTLGNHVKIGRSRADLMAAADREDYLNAEGENVSGLFMGCSGRHLATQETDAESNAYHHFYDSYTAKYWPGFAVFKDNGDPMNRAEGLASFNAYLNNILIWSDNVNLTIADDAEDIWLANFVGGGFRGSMKAKTASGRFAYTLPEGVTIGNAVVGGAYNTDVVYRVYDTENDMHTYKEDGGHYLYRTDIKAGWNEGEDYHHVDRDTEGNITGIIRFYYDGGILSHDNSNARIHQVHADPRANEAEYATAYFEPLTEGDNMESDATKAKLFTRNKNKSFVYLNLRCALEPEVLLDGGGNHSVHGGNVFGGCFMSGLVQGDSWVDYSAWLSSDCTDTYYFDKSNNMHIYSEAADLVRNNALNIFGAGYGENTHTAGDTYLYIKAVAQDAGGDGNKNGKFPYIFNAFGGSYAGRVYGNTNVYYAVGKQGTLLGSLYGGGYKGDIEGNTFVELAEGFVTNVYGGSRQANIGGAAHIWAYDGRSRGIDDANHLIICNLYGGNDIAGTISGTMPAKFTEAKWNTAPTGAGTPRESLTGKMFNTYVEISADDDSANRGFPLIGSAFAGGNGEAWISEQESGTRPDVATTLLEIEGGSTLRAFGGGNKATVTGGTYIFTNAQSTTFANVEFNNYQKNIMTKVFFGSMKSGYRWDENTLRLDPYHVVHLFGGNNLATMDIQPTWNLTNGRIENVYSGGNMGDMTYYNPSGNAATIDGAPGSSIGRENSNGTNANLTPKGLSITIDSPDILIGSLFGGCRMSDVVPGGYATDGEGNYILDINGNKTLAQNTAFAENEDCYGATVNVIDGNIGYVFGGNDVSGKVTHGTNVNISGGVIGQVYGSGNGDYLFKYIPADAATNPLYQGFYDDGMNDTRITEHIDDEHGIYYTVPEYDKDSNLVDDTSTGDTHKIMTINKLRPSVDKAFINIQGMPEDGSGKHITLIKGNVYMGGNATTITRGNEEAFTKFKLGSYVTMNGLFMGSDGYSYTQDKSIAAIAQLNGIGDMGAETDFKPGHELDKQHNPILLNAYLIAVDMNAMPKEYVSVHELREAFIGTICGGGNRGSMLVDKTVKLTVPDNLVIFDKIVAGCLNSTVNYNQNGTIIPSVGGFTRELRDNDPDGNVKLQYTINAQFKPLALEMPGVDLKIPVSRNELNIHGHNYNDAIAHNFLYERVRDGAYLTGNNIYGGCYESGIVVGDVVLNITSDMLGYMNNNGGSIFNSSVINGIDDGVVDNNIRTRYDNALANGQVIGNIFGAGFGQESDVQGDVRISMYSPAGSTPGNPMHPSANSIYGGGRSGQLHGNSYIRITDGHIYSDVVGGCDQSYMYGSTYIGIGFPAYYECNTTGEYALTRGDQWNGDKGVIKTSVYYKEGDFVAPNVWRLMPTSDQAQFTLHNEMVNDPATTWNKTDIIVRGGVYGGGYSEANSTAGMAGNYTVLHELDEHGNKTVYGGNSTIVVADQGDPLDAGNNKDHIRISTLNAKEITFTQAQINAGATTLGLFSYADNKFTHLADNSPVFGTIYYDLTGDGGIYGDGHLTFCEGFRAADITGYGYNTATVLHPRLMNTFQRLDLLDVNDCCLMLQGAQDFATTEKVNATIYSITRIGELRMNSSLNAAQKLGEISAPSGSAPGANINTVKQRNYLGFFNNIHYLGSIVTNDDFASAIFHGADGRIGSNDYKTEKTSYITAYTDADDKNAALVPFKGRNVGTARNAIGINNGFCLRIQNQYKKNDGTYDLYYGPIVGVCEVKLLTLTQGEGGGYVYADNIHSNENHFLNTSGNFVFPGVVSQGDDGHGHPIADQFIVDDCFMDKFGTPDAITTKQGDLDEAHYWYVEGNKYFYNTTLTGYTFQDPMTFNLTDNDPNIVLSGMQNGSSLNIKKIEWLSTHRDGYDCVLENDDNPEKVSDYEFDIEIAGTNTPLPGVDWTNHMPRHSTVAPPLYTTGKFIRNNNLPQFNVKLQDKGDNSGDDNYIGHLDEPELVKIYLEGETDGQTYEYTITMSIVYLQGPTYEGGVTIENCALPGERIGFSTSGITIKTPELMPVTATAWKILPLNGFNGDGDPQWDNDGITIPGSQYSEDLHGNLSGWIKALYNQNEYNIAYIFTAGGHDFPVMPKQETAINPLKENRMIVVHNYHRMKDIVAQGLEESVIEGARVYISSVQDLAAFVEWVNAGKLTQNVDFILQNDITLISALTLTHPFAGTFHGDGYHIDLDGKQASLFGSQLTGQVYNLGLIGGTVATSGTRTNCYEYIANDAFTHGAKAYELSHHFVPIADGYVENYYSNGDYQYATTDRVWSLRTDDPYYGHTETHHNMAHTHDADRWVDVDDDDEHNADILSHTGYHQPLYDGTRVVADADVLDGAGNVIGVKYGLPIGYSNDYLFFGQHLDRENADAYPVHIEFVAKGDVDASKGGNRVYETLGYHKNKLSQPLFYNRDAWAYRPSLTAVAFTNISMRAENDNANPLPVRFSVDSNRDYSPSPYDNSTTGHVSQNLLVYHDGSLAANAVFAAGAYPDNTAESAISYHGIANGSTNYLHLVDKQDFNAPIAFNVNTRAWYERLPQSYRNVISNYQDGSAWEGIVLPFTATKVSAERNGEISHFYGETDGTDHTLHHEYWLRGFKGADQDQAAFARPAVSGDDNFVDSHQSGTEYTYSANTYFTSLYNYNNHYDSRDDEGDDIVGNHDEAWYAQPHTYSDYVRLTAAVPYIVAFPGNDFFEFSMESYYRTDAYGAQPYAQKAIFESGATTIPVTDTGADPVNSQGSINATTVGSYTYNGTYMRRALGIGINANGTDFVPDQEILPFRTYLTVSSLAPLRQSIRIADALAPVNDTDPGQIDSELGSLELRIWSEDLEIVVDTPVAVDLKVYTASGILKSVLHCKEGINRFPMESNGLYFVGKLKLLLQSK